MSHKIVFNLRSRIENEDIAFELFTLFKRIWNVNMNYKHYRTLSRLVVKKVFDVNIWNVVFDLIIIVSRTIFSINISFSFNDTFVTKSFSFFQDSEQIRKIIELAIFYKIKECIYRNIDNFFEKYFERRFWSRKSKIIYNVMKEQYKDERWIDFLDSLDENVVWD